VVAVLLLGGIFYSATQLVNHSAANGQDSVAPTETVVAQEVATVAAAPIRTPGSQATTAPQAAPAAQPTAAPTVAVAALAAATSTPVPATTSAPIAVSTTETTEAPTAEPTLYAPTVTPVDQATYDEVSAAYGHYFDVTSRPCTTTIPRDWTPLQTVHRVPGSGSHLWAELAET
jgi:hypothetical protein